MNFNSWQFLLFYPIVALVYFLLPHKGRWVWLLAASYFFYMCWDPWLIGLILLTTLLSYGASLLIEKDPKRKKLYLIVTLVVCLGLLLTFKYLSFFLNSIVGLINLFPVHLEGYSFELMLPVGISFYTFQTLSYVIDVYRGDFKAERHLGYYALFVAYFPQLVAGPIESPSVLLPQLKEEHKWNAEDFLVGLRHFAFGFILKVLVADFLGIFVNSVFLDLANMDALHIALAGLLFTLEMYGDFNGYSEIAIGSARMMGVRLTKNFDEPYLASTYTEFFHRWHYSLNRWFTHYLYFPLGGSRKGKVREAINKLIVFALCGLWHGANWTYLLWGLYAGIFVALESFTLVPWLKRRAMEGKPDPWYFRWGRRIVLWLIFIPAALLFRASDVNEAFVALGRLFTAFNFVSLSASGFGAVQYVLIIALIAIMVLSAKWVYRDEWKGMEPDLTYKTPYLEQALSWRGLIEGAAMLIIIALAVMLMWLCLLSMDDASAFAYFQF